MSLCEGLLRSFLMIKILKGWHKRYMLPVTNVAKGNNGILKSTFPTYIPLQSTIALLFYNCWACRGCDWKLALFSSPPRVSNACYRTRSYHSVWSYLMCTLSVSKLPDANSGTLTNMELLKKINPSYYSWIPATLDLICYLKIWKHYHNDEASSCVKQEIITSLST